jgi:hypothetical protein
MPCISKPLAWNKNEQDTQSGVDEEGHSQHHDCSLRQEATDVGFSNAREIEWCVLAETNERQDGVKGILV